MNLPEPGDRILVNKGWNNWVPQTVTRVVGTRIYFGDMWVMGRGEGGSWKVAEEMGLYERLESLFHGYHVRKTRDGNYRVCCVVQSCVELTPVIARDIVENPALKYGVEDRIHGALKRVLRERYGEEEAG